MSDSSRINHYANAMFRYEVLHESWLHSCERYLKYVFGDDGVHGRVVIDYAFGRGNWAVAFARCGAARVIAIDASEDNCRRLRSYCAEQRIPNVEVICGNLVEQDLDIGGDLLWLYGILHHVADADSFLEKLLSKVAPDGAVLAYTYNANSLREWMVSAARACMHFKDEDSFRAHSLWLTPAARIRARDDLVAPHITWDDAAQFVARFVRLGWHPSAQVQDFSPWLHDTHSGDFNPYVVKFLRRESQLFVRAQEDNAADLEILRSLGAAVSASLPQAMRTSFAIGLFNTHFQVAPVLIGSDGVYKTNGQIAWEDFKYLLYAATLFAVSEQDFPPGLGVVWNAAMCSLRGEPREVNADSLGGSAILARLATTSIRI